MQESLKIESTKYTPEIILDPINNIFEISGWSIPGNALDFYNQVIHWFYNNIQFLQTKFNFNIKLKFISTSTIKSLNDIFKLLENISQSKKIEITINWFYDKDDIGLKETGEEYQQLIKLPFVFITI